MAFTVALAIMSVVIPTWHGARPLGVVVAGGMRLWIPVADGWAISAIPVSRIPARTFVMRVSVGVSEVPVVWTSRLLVMRLVVVATTATGGIVSMI